MFSFLNLIIPDVGAREPEIKLKRVVLPAPLGPIKPTISPRLIKKSTRSTAANPPKYFLTPFPSRIGIFPGPLRSPPLLNLFFQPDDPLGQEQDNADQDDPV